MSELTFTYPSDQEAKEQIVEMGRRMYERGYVVSNDGNISCRVSDNEMWTTPTGVSKGFMKEEMLVKTDLEGNILEGTGKPSSEIRMHLRVYREDPTLVAVVHAHPVYATLFTIAGKGLDSRILAEGTVQLGVVPCAPTAMPGTQEVPDSIAPYVKGYNAVLLGNHGALTWSDKSLLQAYYRMESLEYYAQLILYAQLFFDGRVNTFTDRQIDELIKIREKLGITRGGRPA